MRWREVKRRTILESLDQAADCGFVTVGELAITGEPRNTDADCFQLKADSVAVSAEHLAFEPGFRRIDVDLSPRTSRVPTQLVPRYQNLEGLALVQPQVVPVDLHIRANPVTKFSFGGVRKEVGLFASAKSRTGSTPVALRTPGRIERPALDQKDTSLEERLRWVLTPPIHEQLSDPSLGLLFTPHDYQVRGISWLRSRTGALLADEMGLGKSMQAIIAARLMWRERAIERILIVCPKTLIRTWREEIDKWWPNASPNVCEPSGDTQLFLKLATANVSIKIINYEKLAREADWLSKGERCGSHDLIIIDEAQRIKNATTSAARAVKALVGHRRWALTGTPLETKIEDVTSIFEFVRPGLVESNDATYVQKRIRPFLLRRRLEEVSLELPEKDDQDIAVELGERQRDAYDRAENDGVVGLNDCGESITVQHVFALIQKLMQLCNFDPVSSDSCKLDLLREDLEEIIESGRKVLVFSQFVNEPFGLKVLKRRLPECCHIVEMHGEVSGRARDAAEHAFKSDPAVNTMLVHYRVGGVGLNLQAANYVYLFNRWWNPAVEDQAVKRVHRIGQENKVFVRRLYCKDTIEERILAKLAERRRLFAHVIDENRPHEAMGLSEEELFSLFEQLKARPRRRTAGGRAPRVVLNDMDDKQFEDLTAQIYTAAGYTVERVGASHDGGVDVWAEKQTGPGRQRIAIQCKHIKANVGRPDVQKLFGVVSADQTITRGDLVTSSDFSGEARSFAHGKRLALINRERLVEWAREVKAAEFEETAYAT